MLVYLATYPRSGSSLLKQLLIAGFDILSSAITLNEAKGFVAPNWDVQPIDDEPRRATYRRQGARYPYVMPGTVDYLTPGRRKQLIRDPNLFVFKTHGLPFRTRLPGERFIHQVRHPGAALWSYFTLEARRAKAKPSLPSMTVERMIAGDVTFGDWTRYHRTWAGFLGSDDLVLSYERTVADLAGAAAAIGSFIEMTPSGRTPSLDDYRAKHPGLPIRGSSDGYEQYYTVDQLETLWDRHGPLASELGYARPDLTQACKCEQVGLLADQLWRGPSVPKALTA